MEFKDGEAVGANVGGAGDDDGTELGAGVGVTGVGRLDGCDDTDGFAVGAGEMIDGVVDSSEDAADIGRGDIVGNKVGVELVVDIVGDFVALLSLLVGGIVAALS